ncbi:MAG: TonB-dependent receptor plug domain-containing protein [Planctomycetota bacterium]
MILLILALLLAAPNQLQAQDVNEPEKHEPSAEDLGLFELPLEELLELEVYSAAKRPQPLGRSASAVYIITAEDIHAAGVTTVPDLLRMVPGVDVSHQFGNAYPVGIRGFARPSAERIEVLIDGRSLYDGFKGGVDFVFQPLFLENIERIEVIRGSAGVIWGTNAENGVINIITKKASETQGKLLYGAFGNRELHQGFLRLGDTEGSMSWRATVGAEHNNGFGRGGGDDFKDYFQGFQTTGRIDLELDGDTTLLLSGGHKRGSAGARGISRPDTRSLQYMNLLWKKEIDETRVLQFRWAENFFHQEEFRFDLLTRKDLLGLQYNFTDDFHNFITGTEYIRDFYDSNPKRIIDNTDPDDFTNDQGSVFIEDELTLSEDLWLTLGGRAHYNELTHFDWSGRGVLVHEIVPKHFIRAGVSRTFRRPIMFEEFAYRFNDSDNLTLMGNNDLKNERLTSWELGYRGKLKECLELNIEGFYNKYKDLIGLRRMPPNKYFNVYGMTTYGIETAVDWRVCKWWLMRAGHSYEHQDKTGQMSDITIGSLGVARVPQHKMSLLNRFYIDQTTTLNTQLFYSDTFLSRIPNTAISKIEPYFKFDVRLAKKIWNDSGEIALGVTNLTDHFHNEFNTRRDGVPRQFYLQFFYYF